MKTQEGMLQKWVMEELHTYTERTQAQSAQATSIFFIFYKVALRPHHRLRQMNQI